MGANRNGRVRPAADPVHLNKLLDVPPDRFEGSFPVMWSDTHAQCGESIVRMEPRRTTLLLARVTCPACRKAVGRLKLKPPRVERQG